MLQEQQLSRSSPEETRKRILGATRHIFARKGRRGTTTREIAELAGVNEATLFRHFGNKDALLEACAAHYCPAGELADIVSGLSGDLHEDLLAIAREFASRLESVRDMIIMSLFEGEGESEDAIGALAWRSPQQVRQIVVDYMARRVASGDIEGQPLHLARAFMGMIFSWVIGRKKFPDEQLAVDTATELFVNVFLNGVRKRA